ncbi:uncharacterized protein LOC142162001 [Nicotiana tabacum]|uniref:Uncharacterized protein LOC142162001 n=1 Tax=Nicotiana tabacum TaxID=4097 RepID=A0AC58RNV0_TOBAC
MGINYMTSRRTLIAQKLGMTGLREGQILYAAYNQNAFVKGRQIVDAAMVANECLEYLFKRKIKGVACKLDLEKAYDHGYFKYYRWPRQRDPLSPYLFLLMMEILSILLQKAENLGWIRGLKCRRSEGAISHILYADDTLILCETAIDQILHLRGVLLAFEAVSVFKVNSAKSNVSVLMQNIALGVLDRCRSKLVPWKKRHLSFGGRLKLVNSVLDGMPTYLMSIIRMPTTVEKKLSAMRNKFLWEGNADRRKLHLVKWQEVMKGIKGEGLGVRNLRLHNKSLLFRWLLRYNHESNRL